MGESGRPSDPHSFQTATNPVSIMRTMTQTLNPLRGATAVGEVVEGAMQSPDPTEAMLRGLIMGDRRGGGTDWEQILGDPSTYAPATPTTAQQTWTQEPATDVGQLSPNPPTLGEPFRNQVTRQPYSTQDYLNMAGLGGGRGAQ
jgi:hypothetical protein